MVSTPESISTVKEIINNCRVIAKVETKNGIKSRMEISRVADAVMVARGDLSVECGIASIGFNDDLIIESANFWKKPIILATGILDSIMFSNKPTISDASDVWNFFKNGTQEFLISGAISINKPIEVLKELKLLLTQMERYLK